MTKTKPTCPVSKEDMIIVARKLGNLQPWITWLREKYTCQKINDSTSTLKQEKSMNTTTKTPLPK